jgi:hypothetical protein
MNVLDSENQKVRILKVGSKKWIIESGNQTFKNNEFENIHLGS